MGTQQVQIFPINQQDAERLQEISRRTFSETFAAQNSAENMRQYLEESLSMERLSVELANPNARFYFAIIDDEVVGYLKVNFGAAQTELQNSSALEIERIYVLKDYHGKQVAQQLFQKAMEIAREAGVDFVWLGVWEENHRAIRFYEKNGFKAFDKHIFLLGDDPQTDIMMKLEMKGIRTLPENQR